MRARIVLLLSLYERTMLENNVRATINRIGEHLLQKAASAPNL